MSVSIWISQKKGAPLFLFKKIQEGLKQGHSLFKLRIRSSSGGHYPNICVPIAGIIDYCRAELGCDFISSAAYKKSHFEQIGIISPHTLDNETSPSSLLDRIWKFSIEDHYEIMKGIADSLRRAAPMESGVILGLELALNEVTDNILQHAFSASESEKMLGFVMVQYHIKEHHVAVAVFDSGQGIESSLAQGGHKFVNAEKALHYALQKGVTDGKGAGNKPWMMRNIISASAGSFELTSNGTKYSLRHKAVDDTPEPKLSTVRTPKEGTTLVDFQLRTDHPIQLEKALDSYSPVNLWLENRLDDQLQNASLLIREESRGCASRYEAKAFANIVCNALKECSGKCYIDFAGIEIVSASYADQLLVSLISELSFIGFLSRIALTNISPSCALVFNTCFNGRFLDKQG